MSASNISHLRLARYCFPPNLYYVRHGEDGLGGTTWYSRSISVLLDASRFALVPPLEMVPELSIPAEASLPTIQTLYDGRADVDPSPFGVTSARYRFVDFSYPVYHDDVHIFSSRRERAGGNVISGVFDATSYLLLCLSIVLAATFFFVAVSHRSSPPRGFLSCLLAFYGSALCQPLPNWVLLLRARRPAVTTLVAFTVLCNVLVASMYGSVIIAKMTAKVDVLKVDTLEDLALPEASHLDVYLVRHSLVDDVVTKLSVHSKIAHKIRYVSIDATEDELSRMLEEILSGSAVKVELRENHAFSAFTLNSGGRCRFPLAAFRRSPSPLFSARGAWLLRKGLAASEQIDIALMWTDAFGTFLHSRDSEGLFSPARMEEDCPKVSDFTASLFQDKQCYGDELDRTNVPSVGLGHLRRAFLFYAAGISISLLAFLLELFLHRSRCPNKRRRRRVRV